MNPVYVIRTEIDPDSKIHGCQHGAHLGPAGPCGPHVGPMNLAIRGVSARMSHDIHVKLGDAITHPCYNLFD